MQRPTTIIPIVGVQYAANSKSIAPQTEVERDAHTLALLNRLQTAGGRVMLIPEPSNRHNPNAILARYRGMSVGYVSDDYLEVVHRALKKNGGRPLMRALKKCQEFFDILKFTKNILSNSCLCHIFL